MKNKKFDLVIIGSDEVFNATIPSSWGFTTQLFGDIDNANKVVSYAASCGSTTFEYAKIFGIIANMNFRHFFSKKIISNSFKKIFIKF